MKEKYEQMSLDTRGELESTIDALAVEAVITVKDITVRCREAPPPVRNRHEAYGHAAEQMRRILSAVKGIRKDTDDLLKTLSDPDLPALDAASSICNSTMKAARIILEASAEMDRIRDDLYRTESGISEKPTPMEKWMAETQVTRYEEAPEDAEDPEDMDLDEIAERAVNGDFDGIPDEVREAAEDDGGPEDFTGEDFNTLETED